MPNGEGRYTSPVSRLRTTNWSLFDIRRRRQQRWRLHEQRTSRANGITTRVQPHSLPYSRTLMVIVRIGSAFTRHAVFVRCCSRLCAGQQFSKKCRDRPAEWPHLHIFYEDVYGWKHSFLLRGEDVQACVSIRKRGKSNHDANLLRCDIKKLVEDWNVFYQKIMTRFRSIHNKDAIG
jgi:hypothetical protein